ncbi:MAG: amino acid adenylation domain-containing protein [Planctomycetes bacterium]|nr:amino acid adenylation domain-containing protein [Planctomycetota bacterium]
MQCDRSNVLEVDLLHQAVESHANMRPDHMAIDQGKRTITYGELAEKMHRLASLLKSHGVKRHDRVGIFMGNSIEACVGILGTLRSDACYVPLNPTFPPPRLAGIVDDAQMNVLITVKSNLKMIQQTITMLEGPSPNTIIVLDLDDSVFSENENLQALASAVENVVGNEALEKASSDPDSSSATEEDLAYLMYTSGTTGKSKGVMISHRNVKTFITWAVDHFKITHVDKMSNHSAMSFDLSVFDIFGAFFAGATLVPLATVGEQMFPSKVIRNRKITIWFSVPSVISMMRMSKQLTPGAFSDSLRLAIFCGEALTPEQVAAWKDTHPDIPIHNIYGPTEATIACTHHNVGVDSPFDVNAPVPIGVPCPSTDFLILERDSDELVADGEIGRLMICGSQLAAGYWRRDDLTEKAFRTNPFTTDFGDLMYESGDLAYRDTNGIYYCLGRVDSQVKVMGYRIELGEIEVVLGRHKNIAESAVVCIKGEMPTLVAAVAIEEKLQNEDTETELLDHCADFLPNYMVPKQVKFFNQLPKNVNGKIDRRAIEMQVQADDKGISGG